MYPGANELCDGLDNDCDGLTDDQDSFDAETATLYYADEDGDGHGSPDAARLACAMGEGLAAAPDDCDDAEADVHPGAEERCDGRDNNCDGLTDDADPGATGLRTFYRDADGDGEGLPSEALEACVAPAGYVSGASDCDDNDALVGSLATERCGDIDSDCDGLIGDLDPDTAPGLLWYADLDLDGHGDPATSTAACLSPGAGWVALGDDCDDSAADVAPGAPEVCGGVDHDCDGLVDDDDPDADPTTMTAWYADADADGAGTFAGVSFACVAPAGFVANADDCDDGDSAISPWAAERCDGVDNDCDGLFDDEDALDPTGLSLSYPDLDGDGYGDATAGEALCTPPAGMVSVGGDCDDDDADVNPAAAEVCDGADNDCDAATSEAGMATFWSAAGSPAADWSAVVTGGNLSLTEPGTLHLCDDTFPVQIDVQDDVELIGHGGAALDAGGAGSALQVGAGASLVRVTGLDLTGGDAVEGGGLRCVGAATVSLSQLTITDNAAVEGGGVYNDGCAIQLTHVDLSANEADEGGGLAQRAGTMLIEGGWVRDNSAALGAALTTNTDLRIVGVTVSDNVGDGMFVGAGAELTCAADELGAGAVTGHDLGATLDTGASLRSYGCDWGSGADDNAVDVQDLGASWSETGWGPDTYATADDTGAAPLGWSSAEGVARYVYGAGPAAPVAPECSVQWDIVSASTEAGCAGCWFAFSLDLTYDAASSEATGACAGLAFDDSATFAWTPDWSGAATLLRYDTTEGWMPWADATLVGDRLLFTQGSADAPIWGGYLTSMTVGELIVR